MHKPIADNAFRPKKIYMEIKSAHFVISNTDVRKCPQDGKPEYAFIGRSNVGKSSLINMLTRQNKLAMTSSTPEFPTSDKNVCLPPGTGRVPFTRKVYLLAFKGTKRMAKVFFLRLLFLQ